MAGQHWGEHGDPDEARSIGDRVIEWVFVGFSMLVVASHAWYAIRALVASAF
jgi:hypothetical protein